MTNNKEQLSTKARPGNKNRLTLGAYSLRDNGELPPEKEELRKYLDCVRENMIEDLGGKDAVTTSQVILVESTVMTLGIMTLMWQWLQKEGVFQKDRAEVQPCPKTMATYLNTLRLNTVSRGLKRSVPTEYDFEAWLRQNTKEAKAEEVKKDTG
jgi:hypothetical protein